MHILCFTGRIAAAPVLTNPSGTKVCKFTLISNEYAGKDEAGEAQERPLSIQFTAFGPKAEAISKHCHKGDQLIIEKAKMENNNYKAADGKEVYGYSFIVDSFEFGAPGAEKRTQLDAKRQG